MDRALVSPEWMNSFPNTQLCHITHTYAGLCPILVSTNYVKKHGPVSFGCKKRLDGACNLKSIFSKSWSKGDAIASLITVMLIC